MQIQHNQDKQHEAKQNNAAIKKMSTLKMQR